ncbi:MAG: TPM domain-containing protein, partial [Pseudomonadota bacterium]
RIEAALRAAEQQTSAEIRVAVSRWYFWGDVRRAAERAFRRLGMTATQRRNGVLVFLSLRRRRFELLGDVAVDEKLTDADWQIVAAILRSHFTRGDLSGGIEAAVARLSSDLARHFPPAPHDRNELPDAVATDV